MIGTDTSSIRTREGIDALKQIYTAISNPYPVVEKELLLELLDGYRTLRIEVKPDPPRKWDVMLDLECYGLRPGCAVRSIGAVCFDPNTDELGAEFYANIRLQGESFGLTVDPKTWKWWAEPAQDLANAMLMTGQRSLGDVAQCFREWFHGVNGGNVWAHGAAFDQPIWDVASKAVGVDVPWHYRAVRDTRTLYALAEYEPKWSIGTKHNALDDAKHQAMCVQAAVKKLRSPWGPVCGRHAIG